MSIVAIAGTAFTYYLPGLEDQANPGLFKSSPTIAAGDFTMSTNGGAFGALTNTPTVSPAGSTQIAIVLSAAETTAAGAGGRITVMCQDLAGAEWYSVGIAIPVQAADVSTLGGTAQTGDAYALLGAAGAGLTALGDARIANLDVTVSSRNATTPPTAATIAAEILVTPANKLATGAAGVVTPSGGTINSVSSSLQVAGFDPAAKQEIRDAATAALAAATSTLTVVSAVDGDVITIYQAVSFQATISGLAIPADWTKVYWTVKQATGQADTDAILQMVETNPAAGTDGLLRLNGAAGTAANGTLTVDQAAGTVVMDLVCENTDELTLATGLHWSLKALATGGATTLLAIGTLNVRGQATQAVA